MKALISTTEPVEAGYRVAQVEQDDNIFPVADTMFWANCADTIIADQFWYDPIDRVFKDLAIYTVAAQNQPISAGAQTL